VILAIDSSIGTSVALHDPSEEGLTVEENEDGRLAHAEVIGTLIRRVLDAARVEPADVSAVASGMGPGPFTGLRIGIAAARAFAVGRGLPVVPIVSHDAIAASLYDSGRVGELVVATDARRREVAWTRYLGRDDAGPLRASAPVLAEREGFVVTSGERVDAEHVSAASIARLAALVLAGRRGRDADEPVYLRAPDVTLSSRKRVTQ
jgi:tRNA threonylcarbamoyl adenosine modification protein YeaZ